jgi:hypothetical protein
MSMPNWNYLWLWFAAGLLVMTACAVNHRYVNPPLQHGDSHWPR